MRSARGTQGALTASDSAGGRGAVAHWGLELQVGSAQAVTQAVQDLQVARVALPGHDQPVINWKFLNTVTLKVTTVPGER